MPAALRALVGGLRAAAPKPLPTLARTATAGQSAMLATRPSSLTAASSSAVRMFSASAGQSRSELTEPSPALPPLTDSFSVLSLGSRRQGPTKTRRGVRRISLSLKGAHIDEGAASGSRSIKLHFKKPDGEIVTVEANEGDDIVDVSWEYDLDIEGASAECPFTEASRRV